MTPEEIEQSLAKLGLQDINWDRPISVEEMLYLLDHCPFLQIVCIGDATPLAAPEFITAASGWKIHHYGDAMSSSPGELLFADGNFRFCVDEDSQGGEAGAINPGKGTIVKQAYDTAAEMIRLAKKFNWQGVQIVDGHPLMQWAAWMEARDSDFLLEGFVPTDKDQQKRQRVKRSSVADQGLLDRSLLRR